MRVALPAGRVREAWGIRLFWQPAFQTAALCLLGALTAAGLIAYAIGPLPLLDFRAYLQAGTAWTQGLDPYRVFLSDPNGPPGLRAGFTYPPYSLPLFGGLAWLGLEHAARLWVTASLVSLAVVVLVLAEPWTGRRVAAAVVLCGVFYPVLANISLGQTGLMTLAGVLLAERLSARGRQVLGGLALSAAAVLKLFPLGLAVPLWMSGRRRAAAAAVGFLAAVVVISLPWSARLWVSYLGGVLLQKASTPTTNPTNQSIAGAMARTFSVNQYQWPLLDAPALGRWLGIALAAAVLAIVLGIGWLVRRRDPGLGFALVLGALPVVIPNALLHYYVLALPLLWLALQAGIRRRDPWLWGAVVFAELTLSIGAASIDHVYFAISRLAPGLHGVYANLSVLGGIGLLVAGCRMALTRDGGALGSGWPAAPGTSPTSPTPG